jgi:hypothetical protein
MIDIGVASPSAQGQAMIRTAIRVDEGVARNAAPGPRAARRVKVTSEASMTVGSEPAGDPISEPLDWGPAPLGCADQR